MNELVGKRQVTDSIIVLMTIEIVAVTTECLTESMRIIKHGGYTVKAEAIEMEFFKPVLTVRKQEMKHIILTIIEAKGVPSRMLMTVAGIEELVRIASEIAQALDLVLHGVAVDDVHDDGDAVLVGGVDEFLQFFRCSKSARWGEEA